MTKTTANTSALPRKTANKEMTFLPIPTAIRRMSQNWPSRRRPPRRWWAGIMVAMVLAGSHRPLVSADQPHNVAVLDFSTSGPLPSISGLTPGRFAADDLAEMLARITHRPLRVIPRKGVREAEASLHWQSTDLLRFDRLAQLAQRVGADHLFVGRVERLDIPGHSALGGSMFRVTASVRVQVFDAAAKRFVGDARGSGLALSPSQLVAAQQALHDANAEALPQAISKLPHAP